MRRLLAIAAILTALLASHAAEEPKLNSLTPQEISEGWLLLFDGETSFGWTVKGDAKVNNGIWVIGGAEPTTLQSTTQFGLGELTFLGLVEGKDSEATFSIHGINILRNPTDKWLPYRIKVAAGSVEIDSNGKTTAIKLTAPLEPGPIKISVPAGGRMRLRDVKLRPFGVKSIFNGKDLTGWKEHPGKKSKCGVNDQGEITMKDGPGDLQSEGQWDDFVLQIECKTNGKHLNSGVFFRCRPNEYQQGYEAQIHNGFAAEPNKEYTIETYDPESGKVLTTRKEKYAALDYGTGGIYRRMPARKQAAQDGEWFTMTVVAQGWHMATWVNGLQVVDWTDTRPVKDNARNGCKLEKGPISLQGHDPTTDLNFKNIRIGQLPKGEKK
jgi:Domain of Unknown Function (DUF1080)